jgi:hypothetical protein
VERTLAMVDETADAEDQLILLMRALKYQKVDEPADIRETGATDDYMMPIPHHLLKLYESIERDEDEPEEVHFEHMGDEFEFFELDLAVWPVLAT